MRRLGGSGLEAMHTQEVNSVRSQKSAGKMWLKKKKEPNILYFGKPLPIFLRYSKKEADIMDQFTLSYILNGYSQFWTWSTSTNCASVSSGKPAYIMWTQVHNCHSLDNENSKLVILSEPTHTLPNVMPSPLPQITSLMKPPYRVLQNKMRTIKEKWSMKWLYAPRW